MLAISPPAEKARCPHYDSWSWGVGGFDGTERAPYVEEIEDMAAAVRAFAARDVWYLPGLADVCDVAKATSPTQCESHGLEITCADELQGAMRLKRFERYNASLAEHYAVPKVHNARPVPDVGHAHSLIFQSAEALSVMVDFVGERCN